MGSGRDKRKAAKERKDGPTAGKGAEKTQRKTNKNEVCLRGGGCAVLCAQCVCVCCVLCCVLCAVLCACACACQCVSGSAFWREGLVHRACLAPCMCSLQGHWLTPGLAHRGTPSAITPLPRPPSFAPLLSHPSLPRVLSSPHVACVHDAQAKRQQRADKKLAGDEDDLDALLARFALQARRGARRARQEAGCNVTTESVRDTAGHMCGGAGRRQSAAVAAPPRPPPRLPCAPSGCPSLRPTASCRPCFALSPPYHHTHTHSPPAP